MSSLAERLTWVRTQHGWTRAELAEKVGTSEDAIAALEADAPSRFEWLTDRLAEVLHVSAEWLWSGSEPMLGLNHMTPDEQVKRQSGRGSKGLPGFVVIPDGVWEQNKAGEWTVKGRRT